MIFTIANWIAPSVVALLGPKATMLVGVVPYAVLIAQLFIFNTILLYVTSAMLGLGAALLWTAQVFFYDLMIDIYMIGN